MASIGQVKISNTLYDINSIEYIVGSISSGKFAGTTKSSSLETGKAIAYKMPSNTDSIETYKLNLTLTPSGTSGDKWLYWLGRGITNDDNFNGKLVLMVYDGTDWNIISGKDYDESISDALSGVNTLMGEVYDNGESRIDALEDAISGALEDLNVDTTTDSFVQTISATTNNFVNSVSATSSTISVATVSGKKLVINEPSVLTSISSTSSAVVTAVTSTSAMAVTGAAITTTIPSAVGVYF